MCVEISLSAFSSVYIVRVISDSSITLIHVIVTVDLKGLCTFCLTQTSTDFVKLTQCLMVESFLLTNITC